MIGDHSRRRCRDNDADGRASHNGRLLRLIASDLDGTLLRSDRETVSARTRAALKRASDAGIAIVLVSARGPRDVSAIADGLSIDGLAICSNGAIIYDLATRETIRHRQLASEVAADIIRKLRKRLPDVCFAAESGAVIAFEPSFKGAWDGWQPPKGTVYRDALDLVAAPVTKLIARDAGRSIEDLAAAAREAAGEAAAVSVSGEWVIEILAAGVNKAAALEELADALGVKADEVVAFGDYPNDLSMLAWAGRSIAPANAHPEVLASVDHVTASNDDDGAAIAIEELLAQAKTTVPISDARDAGIDR
jgi:Cof subfamily protein (haloacid dehalogenase superfamily)